MWSEERSDVSSRAQIVPPFFCVQRCHLCFEPSRPPLFSLSYSANDGQRHIARKLQVILPGFLCIYPGDPPPQQPPDPPPPPPPPPFPPNSPCYSIHPLEQELELWHIATTAIDTWRLLFPFAIFHGLFDRGWTIHESPSHAWHLHSVAKRWRESQTARREHAVVLRWLIENVYALLQCNPIARNMGVW